ncbi:phosphatidylserine decarboxylase [Desulfomonile tiedjei]|uniref:Phosphatidylserine decarboxylase n=1 Tax=Desulfomonile tiedjei (strain ATCC 49306 / DSM 6799 / DCB-1) TaxID=706587 RepID=I4CEZ7_DESTA|nr:phosphatidylserine decarboxylase [Desulfomonile tiedjei]AFM28138.1 phosphatidylserine decarboxylase [Desulfomonile tiedjei DSM 6799]
MRTFSIATIVVLLAAFLFWRYVWFFRNPERVIPTGENVVSPADGTVVYVKKVAPGEEVISIKEGLAARVEDIIHEDTDSPKIVIGIFMSPFNVHYNRAPITAKVESINHHPPKLENLNMGPMHWRTVFGVHPLHENSLHIVHNERVVTRMSGRFKGADASFYVVQIAGKNVHGIDSYFQPGSQVGKGEIFGMIRIGSQVDLIFPDHENAEINVKPGDKVYAGETILLK